MRPSRVADCTLMEFWKLATLTPLKARAASSNAATVRLILACTLACPAERSM